MSLKENSRVFLVMLLVSLLVISIAFTGCSKSGGDAEGKVAAEVNGEKIYSSEVEEQLNAVIGGHSGQFEGEEGQQMLDSFRKQILESLIERVLIVQEARNQGMEATQSEIDSRLEEIKGGFASEQEFKAALQQSGITEEELPKEIEKMILSEKMMAKVFEGIEVTTEEAKNYYQENKEQYVTSETANVAHILVSDEQTATEVIEKINSGTSFEDAVKEYSEDTTSKENEGKIGFQTKNSLEQNFGADFADTAFSLKKGEVYDKPIQTAAGYHVIKLVEKREAGQRTFDEVVNQIKSQLLQQEQSEVYQKWMEEVKSKADIKRYI